MDRVGSRFEVPRRLGVLAGAGKSLIDRSNGCTFVIGACSSVQPKSIWGMSVKGKVKEQWGKLTDDELDRIEGRRDQLAGAIQKRYGIAKDEAERQMKEFEKSCDSCATSTAHRMS